MDIVLDQDYLAAGDHIAARIRAEATGVRRVESMATLYEALASGDVSQLTSGTMPAVFVGFDGDTPGDSAGGGSEQVSIQRWLVVLAVADVRRADTGRGAADAAGTMLVRLLRALTGWAPAGATPLQRLPAPRPGFRDGVGFYPLMFTTAIVVDGLNED